MTKRIHRLQRSLAFCGALAALALGATITPAHAAPTPGEVRTEAALAAAVAAYPQNPTAFTLFMEHIPKGGDLHHHLTGAVYAESYINYAAADGDCIDANYTFVPPPCDAVKGPFPVAAAMNDFLFRNRIIDALSARNYIPGTGEASPQVHFFQTFFRFDLIVNKHWPEELAEVEHRSALEHELYIETDLSPDKFKSMAMGDKVGWTPNFDEMRAKLDAAGMPALVAESRKNLDEGIAGSRKILGCDGPTPDVGCNITMRYIFQVLRDRTDEVAFAQIQTAFELANVDSRVVSVNPVESQDDFKALRNYDIQMHMFAYFHKLYPKVKLTMHAGELRPGLVPLEDMYSPGEIHEAIELAGATRIGHGLDVLYEHDPEALLAEMKKKDIMVEVAGGHYMLPVYIAAGVPVSIATDDEGVGRIDLLHMFDFDTRTYHLDYYELKKMVRDSLEHAFIGGADLWNVPEGFDAMVPACSAQPLTDVPAAPACRAFLAASPRATLEWKEEVAFDAFERQF
jgi:hypothetical protein